MSLHRLCCCTREPPEPPCPPDFDLQATITGLDGGAYGCRPYTGLQSADHWARITTLQNVDGTYTCRFLSCGGEIDPRTGLTRPSARYAIEYPAGQNAWLGGIASRSSNCARFNSTTILSRCGPVGEVIIYRDDPVELHRVEITVGATFVEPLDMTGTQRREFYATVFAYLHEAGDAPDVAPPGSAQPAGNTPGNFPGEFVPGCLSGTPLAARHSTGSTTSGAGEILVEMVP